MGIMRCNTRPSGCLGLVTHVCGRVVLRPDLGPPPSSFAPILLALMRLTRLLSEWRTARPRPRTAFARALRHPLHWRPSRTPRRDPILPTKRSPPSMPTPYWTAVRRPPPPCRHLHVKRRNGRRRPRSGPGRGRHVRPVLARQPIRRRRRARPSRTGPGRIRVRRAAVRLRLLDRRRRVRSPSLAGHWIRSPMRIAWRSRPA